MTSKGGFGLTVKIDIGGTQTVIVDLLEGEVPEFEKFLAEMTPHNATGGYAKYVATGKRKMNEFKVTLGWDKDEATHSAVRAAFDSLNPVNMTVISPDGTDETIAFSAHVNKLGRIADQEDGYKCDVTIQPTGAPSITP